MARDRTPSHVTERLTVGPGSAAGGRRVLVTGGAGYIGTHTCVALLDAGHDVVIVDDLSNSHEAAVSRVRQIAPGRLRFRRLDLGDPHALDRVFRAAPIDAVIHLAGRKAVGDSVADPLRYWQTNVGGTLSLIRSMVDHGVRHLVFSSSCTVYGNPTSVPIAEDAPLRPVNPYGRTKLAAEQLLADLATSDRSWHVVALRYFNPAGAHPSGTIGEDPLGTPDNLMPFIMQVAVGRRPALTVFGDGYDTPDGTCVRDYLHVMDLADAHVAALDRLDHLAGFTAINLGTGKGSSVLDVLRAASRSIGRELPHHVGPPRPGDAASAYADPTLAFEQLGWRAERDLDQMCADAWRWQSANPNGYSHKPAP